MRYWAELVIFLLGTNLLIRLINSAKLIGTFPFDLTNDISAYMSQLHFLKVCGFLEWCPYWYNGFINLQMSSPGWYFFAYPLYLISGNVTAAMYLSMVVLFTVSFLLFFYIGKRFGLSPIKRIAFFLLFFANASAIGNFIRNGRQHSMLNLIWFVLLFYIIWTYKDKSINKVYFFSSVIYSFMLVTHYQETVLAAVLFCGLFLYKKAIKEKLLVGASFLLAFVLASWWLIPFVKGIKSSNLINLQEGLRVFEFSKEVLITNLLTYIIPLTLLILFYVYYKKNPVAKRELLFFLPILVLAFLYLFKITALIPILKNISQDPYLFIFLFFILFLFFKEEKFFLAQKWFGKILIFGIVLVTVGNVLLSVTYTPFFIENNPIDEEVQELLLEVEGRFYVLGTFILEGYPQSHAKAYTSFASIYNNLSSIDGWSTPLTSKEYITRFDKLTGIFFREDCKTFREELIFFNATNVMTDSTHCPTLQKCGFTEVKSLNYVCLYKVK